MPIGDSRTLQNPRTTWQLLFAVVVVLCALMICFGSLWVGQQAYAEESSGSSTSSAAAAASSTSDSSEGSAASEASDASSSSAAAASSASEADDPFKDAVSVELADGIYLIDVSLEGGTGKASVESPAQLEVFDGRGVVTLVWSSPHYDYMVVNNKKYLPVNDQGNSTFIVPVVTYDTPFEVVGDTTAMGEPHEIDYKITVTLDSAEFVDENTKLPASMSSEEDNGLSWPWIVFIVCAVLSVACIGITIGVLRNYRNRQ